MRTVYETNKAYKIAREQRAYNTTVLELCETRWTQTGQVRLNTGELILYSGHDEEDDHHIRVAIVLTQEAQSAPISSKAAGPRSIYASIKTKKKKIKLNIIQCYAPTNEKEKNNGDLLQEPADSARQNEGEGHNNTNGIIQGENRI